MQENWSNWDKFVKTIGENKIHCLVIWSHDLVTRLTTIRNADLIVALKDGIVQEKGTHDELMKCKGLYFDLVESQLSGKDEEEANDFVQGLPEKSESSKKHLTRQMSRQISSAKLGKKLIQIGG